MPSISSCIVALLFYVSCVLSSKIKTLDYSKIIWPISKEFKMKNVNLVKSPSFQDVALSKKMLTMNNLTINIQHEINFKVRNRNTPQQNAFLFLSSDQLLNENITMELQAYIKSQTNTIIVISDNQLFENIMSSLIVDINKEVYLFKISSWSLHETYHVNNVHVKNLLGQIKPESKLFTWEENVEKNLIIRRSNFQGIVLKSSSNWSGSRLKLDLTYKETAPYYSENDTYLINGYTSGIYQDVLEIFEKRLNFSTLLYLRGDGVWGNVYHMTNGTTFGTGIIGDLYYNRVDLAIAPLYIKHSRGLYIDYLPPLDPYLIGIYTPRIGDSESYDFAAFLSIFSTELWVFILVSAFFIAGIKLFLLHMHGGSVRIFIDTVVFLWTSFIANFGGKPPATKLDKKPSYRIVVFTSLLCGMLIWIGYRSMLIAVFSVTYKKYPFTDLEGFSKTDWR